MTFIPAPAVKAIRIRVNVSTASTIDECTLLNIFHDPTTNLEQWIPQLEELFSTVPLSMIERFMLENSLSIGDIKRVFYRLPPVWQNSKFKQDLESGVLHG